MDGNINLGHDERVKKEAPQLVAILKEMKDGLDAVRSKVEALTVKVRHIFPFSSLSPPNEKNRKVKKGIR